MRNLMKYGQILKLLMTVHTAVWNFRLYEIYLAGSVRCDLSGET